jgi:hypothetical protein
VSAGRSRREREIADVARVITAREHAADRALASIGAEDITLHAREDAPLPLREWVLAGREASAAKLVKIAHKQIRAAHEQGATHRAVTLPKAKAFAEAVEAERVAKGISQNKAIEAVRAEWGKSRKTAFLYLKRAKDA